MKRLTITADQATRLRPEIEDSAPTMPAGVADALELFFASYSARPDDTTYIAYWLALCDLPVELIGEGLGRLMRRPGEWRPTPGQVRDLCQRIFSERQAELRAQIACLMRPAFDRLRELRASGASLDEIMEFNAQLADLERATIARMSSTKAIQ